MSTETGSVGTGAASRDGGMLQAAETWDGSSPDDGSRSISVVDYSPEEAGPDQRADVALRINTPTQVDAGSEMIKLAQSMEKNLPRAVDEVDDTFDGIDRRFFGVLRTLVMMRDSFGVPLSENTRSLVRTHRDYLFLDCDIE